MSRALDATVDRPSDAGRIASPALGVLLASVSRRAAGVFEAVRRLCQSLVDRDLRVSVFGLADEYSATDGASWRPLRPQVFQARRPLSFGWSGELGAALRAAQLDLIHAHGLWMYPSLANLRAATAANRPYVISPHGMLDPWALRQSRWKKRLASFLFECRHLRRAACLHALTVAEARACRAYGLENPVAVIPNGIDLPESGPRLPAPWGGDADGCGPALLFLGRIHPKKGLCNLLSAWAQVRRDRGAAARDWLLVIAGWDQGGHEAELREQQRQLDLGAAVRFVGPVHGPDKAAAFRHAEAFVLPSFSEGLPMAVLEAWAHGLPAVLTPECNLPQGFAAGAALRVKPDARDLARGLHELLDLSAAQRRSMGARGRDLVAQQFTWPHIAAAMHATYDWVLGAGPRPSCIWEE
jgi:poly(glycerol-phosphate) alpha-glucosyltransferase